jgi:hypothetical protein
MEAKRPGSIGPSELKIVSPDANGLKGAAARFTFDFEETVGNFSIEEDPLTDLPRNGSPLVVQAPDHDGYSLNETFGLMLEDDCGAMPPLSSDEASGCAVGRGDSEGPTEGDWAADNGSAGFASELKGLNDQSRAGDGGFVTKEGSDGSALVVQGPDQDG